MTMKSKRGSRVFPPDPEGLNEECAARARKALAVFTRLSGSARETAVRDLLHELMHLCDRDSRLGGFGDALGWAYSYYADCATEHLQPVYPAGRNDA